MKQNTLSIIGVVVTIFYGVVVYFLIQGKLHTLDSLGLNNIGDFLAGAFGPIAIFWLILGFFQQGKELKQSTEALQLQAKELNNSVEQQKELVNITTSQIESIKVEEKTNRTLLLIGEWSSIILSPEEELYTENTYEGGQSIIIDGKIDNFIKKLMYFSNNNTMKKLIDLRTIISVINSDNINEKYLCFLNYCSYRDEELKPNLEAKVISKASFDRQKKVYPRYKKLVESRLHFLQMS